jgi:hypothetical protein
MLALNTPETGKMAGMIALFLFYGLAFVVMSILVVAFSAIGACMSCSLLALVFPPGNLLKCLLWLIERILGRLGSRWITSLEAPDKVASLASVFSLFVLCRLPSFEVSGTLRLINIHDRIREKESYP